MPQKLSIEAPRKAVDKAEMGFTSLLRLSDANFYRCFTALKKLVAIAANFLLHTERRVKRSLRMTLVRDRSAEQSKDAVAGGLGDVAAVTLQRVHHQLQCRVK